MRARVTHSFEVLNFMAKTALLARDAGDPRWDALTAQLVMVGAADTTEDAENRIELIALGVNTGSWSRQEPGT